jgi:hypothetical protein
MASQGQIKDKKTGIPKPCVIHEVVDVKNQNWAIVTFRQDDAPVMMKIQDVQYKDGTPLPNRSTLFTADEVRARTDEVRKDEMESAASWAYINR